MSTRYFSEYFLKKFKEIEEYCKTNDMYTDVELFDNGFMLLYVSMRNSNGVNYSMTFPFDPSKNGNTNNKILRRTFNEIKNMKKHINDYA